MRRPNPVGDHLRSNVGIISRSGIISGPGIICGPGSFAGQYLEFNERETKTGSGNDPRNVRAIAPKMLAVSNNEKCPVKVYKVYAEKRHAEMKTDHAPFYLAVNNVISGSGKPWFKKAPVGVNELNTLMKTMAQKVGLGPNLKKTTAAEKL